MSLLLDTFERKKLAGDPLLEVSQRMMGVDWPSHYQRMGSTGAELLALADAFPAQEPQDCVVVGGGEQIQKLQRQTWMKGRRTERKKD